MSNTAATALMAPLAKAVMAELRLTNQDSEELTNSIPKFAVAVDLGIAYGSLLGGMATLTGTGIHVDSIIYDEFLLYFAKMNDT
jgi:di/tricarboxylate transporter